MQAWEQQVASLSRQVANVTSEQEDAQRERQILLDSLRASEQVRMSYKTGLTRSAPDHSVMRLVSDSALLTIYCI